MAGLLGPLSNILGGSQPLALVATVIFLFVVSSAWSTGRQYFRLQHVKGPATTGISKWWLIRHVMGGRTQLDLYEVCQKYGLTHQGDLARVGPNDLVTSDPDLVRHMVGVRSSYKRSYWYHAMRFDPARDNVLSMIEEEPHRLLRAKMAHGYSGKEIENLESTIDNNILALVELVQKYVSANKAFDFGPKTQYFTMDTISNLAFGDSFGFLKADDDLYDYCKTFQTQMPALMFTSIYPWLVDLLQWPIIKSAVPSEKDLLGFGKVMGIANEVAAKRYHPDAEQQKDMLGSFIAHSLTQEESKSETVLQIIAGSDTTAGAIRATMLYIMTNPRVTNKLLSEINAVLDPFSADSLVVTEAQAHSMPYLQAIIKEGIRIHPSVVGLQSKEVPPEGDTWNGIHLPGDTNIGYCYWGIMRRSDIWGDDAAEFRPERWLEASPEKLARMEMVCDLAFGSGKWQCLGRNVALLELDKVFVELLRRFEFVLVDPTNPWNSINAGVFIQRDFWVKAYNRK